MEFCDDNLENYGTSNDYSEIQALEVVQQLTEGLKALHMNKIIHRDLKPDNILMKRIKE